MLYSIRKAVMIKKLLITLTFFATVSLFAQPYSLSECKRLALQNNVKSLNADLEVQSAVQTKRAAFTKFFPSVNANGGAFRFDTPFIDVDISNVDLSVSLTNSQYNIILQNLLDRYGAYLSEVNINMKMMKEGLIGGITAIQPVFAGGRIINGNKLAGAGIEAAQYKRELALDEIILKTEQNYWLVISLEEKMKTVRLVATLLDTLYKDVTLAYNQGIINKNDLLKVKIKQNELRSNRLQLENGIEMAKMALCQYIGVIYSDNVIFSDTLPNPEDPLKYKIDHQSVISNRTESKLLDLSVRAQNLQKKMVIGESMPQLGIGCGYLYNNVMGKNKTNAVLFASLKIPLSAWWEASHNIKKQQIQEKIAENNRRDLTELMLLQMEQSWNEVEEAYIQIGFANDAVAQAAENLKLSDDQYQSGVVTISELLEAQSLLQNCRNQYTEQCITYQIKLRSYLQMTGQSEK